MQQGYQYNNIETRQRPARVQVLQNVTRQRPARTQVLQRVSRQRPTRVQVLQRVSRQRPAQTTRQKVAVGTQPYAYQQPYRNTVQKWDGTTNWPAQPISS